jgi:hypothetical protein
MQKQIKNSLSLFTRAALGLALVLSIAPTSQVVGMEKPYPGTFFENDDLLMVVIPRTPEQMAAFYEARGFPQTAIDKVTATCFVTIHIDNRSRHITWLETANWRLTSQGNTLDILGRESWEKVWQEIDLPQAFRSTFFWTQLPPVVDLHPDEPVGGNIVLPGSTERFDILANFRTGADKQGEALQVHFTNIECGKTEAQP